MKSNILTIIKKEFARFFLDKRMVVTTLILPGLMIYVIYSFMGEGMGSKFSADKEYTAKVCVVNLPNEVNGYVEGLSAKWTPIEESQIDDIKTKIQEKEVDLLAVFPSDFSTMVEAYDPMTAGNSPANVAIYYNSTNTNSQHTYSMFTESLNQYENSMANKFDVNSEGESYDLATKEDNTAQIFASMLPMLMMIFLFSGCMGIVPEAIAGEKERGTIATLLITPMKRSELAIGKIVSLGVIALLSGISSFTGTMLSIPKLMGASLEGVSTTGYHIMDYVVLLFVILSTVLVISSAISIISAFSKSVKEASTAVMPLMIVVMLIGVTSMLGDGAAKNPVLYLVPLYNSVQCMNGVFSFSYEPLQMILTVASNIVYTCIMVFVLTKLFDNEKVMFSK